MFTMYASVSDLTGSQTKKLYDPTVPGELYVVTEPKLEVAESSAGKLTFTIPPTNNCFGFFYNTTDQNGEANALNLYVDVRKDGNIVWKGRMVSKEIDFWNCIKVTCEGLLAVLNDTIQPPAHYNNATPRSYLQALLDIHNSRVNDNARKIYLGNVTVGTIAVDAINRYTNYETTLSCIIEKIVKNIGGRIKLRYDSYFNRWYLDYLAEYNQEHNQKIEFGKNLFDYSRSMSSEEYCTVVVPRGKQLEEGEFEDIKAYTTVASVNGGSIYVSLKNSDYDTPPRYLPTNLYGSIERVVDWSEIDDPSALLSKAKEWLKDKQFSNMELEITAMDMYYAGASADDIEIGDTVRVVSEPHGLDRAFPVTKMEINLDTPENTMFTLGEAVKISMTSANNRSSNNVQNQLAEIPTQQKLTTVFKQEAAELINAATTGYVNIIQNDETGAEEFVVSDTPNYKEPYRAGYHEGVWRWTFGGLGFQRTYGDSDYSLALTRDGHINGELISAKTVVADQALIGIITDQKSNHNFWFNLDTGEYHISAIDSISNTINGLSTIYATKSELNITSSNISTSVMEKVEKTYATKKALATAQSQIDQNATAITTKVSLTDITGNFISSTINQTATTVAIKASKINLEGLDLALTSKNITISSTNFSVTKDGKITARSGTIGGFTIDSTSIRNKAVTDNSTDSTALSSTTFQRTVAGASRNLRFAIGSKFGVSGSGIVYASDIRANGGNIGGFTIDGNSIRSSTVGDTSSGAICLRTIDFTRAINGTNRTLRFAIGSKFGVTSTGVLYATDANISGTISSTNATITGGTFKVTTSGKSNSAIVLKYGSYEHDISPSGDSYYYYTSPTEYTGIGYDGITLTNGYIRGTWKFSEFALYKARDTKGFAWNGTVITHAFTNYGDISETGCDRYGSNNYASIANNTWTRLAYVSLPSTSVSGKWILIGNVQFTSNATGYRQAVISASSGSGVATTGGAFFGADAADGGETSGSLVTELTTNGGTYYLNVRHNAGKSITCSGSLRAIRIA